MEASSSFLADKLIEHIVEFSADAQIKRRQVDAGSPEFHELTGAIVAYGRTLRDIAMLQQPHRGDYLLIGSLNSGSLAAVPPF